MEKHEFVKRIEELKPILKGRWRSISERSGVDYNTIQNYAKGFATHEDLRIKIINACEEEVLEVRDRIEQVT